MAVQAEETRVATPGTQDVGSRAEQVLREVFGYPAFRGEQKEIVTHLASGGDALVLMPTGGGKSLCYQLPAAMSQGKTVIVATHDRSIAKEADIRLELTDGRITSTGNYIPPIQSLTMTRKKKGKKK